MATEGWSDALPLDELEDGRAVRVELDGQPVLVARDGERLFAIGARCTHQGAPLTKGAIRFGALDQVTCPVHGSVFALADGRVLRGPATRPEPAFDVRVSGGMVQLRPRA
jgi:nitrite reductase/ring-hydroxylating ferredoxin subunit